MTKIGVFQALADVRKQVIKSPSSLFSKEDVNKLLNNLQEQIHQIPSAPLRARMSPETIELLAEQVAEGVENNLHRIVDNDNCSFCITYDNRIEIEDIEVDGAELESTVLTSITEFIAHETDPVDEE